MDKILRESGLDKLYHISPLTDNVELAHFLGKHVRYKRELLTPEFIYLHGTISVTGVFYIKYTQRNCDNKEVLRGYFDGDIFGRCMDPKDVEIVDPRKAQKLVDHYKEWKDAFYAVEKYGVPRTTFVSLFANEYYRMQIDMGRKV